MRKFTTLDEHLLTDSLRQRILDNIMPIPFCGCWIWMGFIGPQGYGMITSKNVSLRAHRASYALFKGPIPDGLILDHLCRVTSCVNPNHLEPVTDSVNTLRGAHPSRLKTCCPNGHPYDKKTSRGRDCKRCNTLAAREYRKRKCRLTVNYTKEEAEEAAIRKGTGFRAVWCDKHTAYHVKYPEGTYKLKDIS